MASGSTAPFSGEFVDLENVPNLPEGISAEQILEQNADAIRQAAEARHAAGLSQINADGGFFDAFVNQNKISNLNGAELSANTVQLSSNIISGFENSFQLSSPWSNWKQIEPAETVKQNTSNPISGTGSLEYVSGGETNDRKIISDRGSNITPDKFQVKIELLDLFTGDEVFAFKLFDDSGGKLGQVAFKPNINEIEFRGGNFGTRLKSGFTDNKVYKFEFTDIDFSSDTMTVSINGSFQTGVDFQNPCNGIARIEIANDTFSSDAKKRVLIDDIIAGSNKFSTSATAKEKKFTFTDSQGNAFSPSKVGIFPDQTLNGQSITYDLKDSTGTVVKTFNQSDLNQLQSVSTTDTTFQVEANLSGNGSQTPELEFLDVRGV